jgi:hypothetical protein
MSKAMHIDGNTPRLSGTLMGALMTAALVAGGCGGVSGKQAEARRREEHPCQYSATSKQCQQQLSVEKRQEEARHETRVLHERARVDAERQRLKSELGR